MENKLFLKDLCTYGFGFERVPDSVCVDISKIIKKEIGDEKIKLYDSFKDKRFVKNIQSHLQKDPKLMKIVEEYQDPSKFERSLFDVDYDQLYFKIINKDEGNHGFFYSENLLNYDILPYNPVGQSSAGGLYSCKPDDVCQYRFIGNHLLPVVIPQGIPTYFEESSKYKSPVLYALNSIPTKSIDMLYLGIKYEKLNEHDKMSDLIFGRTFLNNSLFYSNSLTVNEGIYEVLNKCLKIPEVKKVKSDVYYWNLIQTYLSKEKYDELYQNILLDQPASNNIGVNDFSTSINVANMFYIFYKYKDPKWIQYLKSYFFPRLIKENEENEIRVNKDVDFEKISDQLNKDINFSIQEILSRFHGIVSGSILLEILMEKDKINSNDIDIYIHSQYFGSFLEFCKERNMFYSFSGSDNEYNMKEVFMVMELVVPKKKKIQIIFVSCDPIEFVFDNFDFDSCMNCYSYHTHILKIGHPSFFHLNEMTISDKYMKKIFVEKDGYSLYRAGKTMERSIKYIKRGFKITNLLPFLDDVLQKLFSKSDSSDF